MRRGGSGRALPRPCVACLPLARLGSQLGLLLTAAACCLTSSFYLFVFPLCLCRRLHACVGEQGAAAPERPAGHAAVHAGRRPGPAARHTLLLLRGRRWAQQHGPAVLHCTSRGPVRVLSVHRALTSLSLSLSRVPPPSASRFTGLSSCAPSLPSPPQALWPRLGPRCCWALLRGSSSPMHGRWPRTARSRQARRGRRRGGKRRGGGKQVQGCRQAPALACDCACLQALPLHPPPCLSRCRQAAGAPAADGGARRPAGHAGGTRHGCAPRLPLPAGAVPPGGARRGAARRPHGLPRGEAEAGGLGGALCC